MSAGDVNRHSKNRFFCTVKKKCKNNVICVKYKEKNVKEVKMHKILVSA